jgi:DNA polymerase (family X)
MDKSRVAKILSELAVLMDLKGENPFKVRAYENAARVVEGLTDDIGELVRSKTIGEVKGIGKGLAEKITELVITGKLEYYEELKSSFPKGVPEMLRIQGLGPKKVKVLYEKLHIESVEQLKQAALEGRLRSMEGFGEKTEQNILKGIELLQAAGKKKLYPEAYAAAQPILAMLKSMKEVKRSEVAGSLRRKKETIGDIDIVASATDRDRDAIMKRFVSHKDATAVLAHGDTKSSVVLESAISCDLRIVKDSEYAFALNYFTGSKEHNVEMRSRARDHGWSLNEYAFSLITDSKGKKQKSPPKCTDEEEIYKALGLSYVPPELREMMGEFEAAEKGSIPDLIEEKDLRGTFHCHTTYSDGRNTIEEMAKAAKKRGWEYLGIADHSQIAAYAGGLTPEKVRKQLREIDKFNAASKGFRLFKGTEVDILGDGSLDFSDKVLADFEYVVASIHSKFKMTEAEATKRLIKALKNKYVTALGHPTGRLLLGREGYPVNLAEVVNAAAEYGKALEINAHPQRLDLDWRMVKYARDKKVPIFINPDAHTTDGLGDVQYGINTARKGWLTAKQVVNTRSSKDVEKLLRSVRS